MRISYHFDEPFPEKAHESFMTNLLAHFNERAVKQDDGIKIYYDRSKETGFLVQAQDIDHKKTMKFSIDMFGTVTRDNEMIMKIQFNEIHVYIGASLFTLEKS